MSIKFSFYNTPNPDKEGEQLCHARLVSQGTKKLDDVCTFISECSTLSSADIKGALEALTVYIGRELANGYNVELEGFGNFSPSLKTRQGVNEKGAPVTHVEVDSVNFRCANRLKDLVGNHAPQRTKRKNVPSAGQDGRKQKMMDHLQRNNCINASDYARINNCSHYQADKDLKQFLADGLIGSMGYRTHRLYVLPGNKEELNILKNIADE